MNRRRRSRFVERNEALIRTSLNRYQGIGTPAYTYDISTGGARIVASKPFAVGTAVRIRIDLAKTGESVTLDGEIKWLQAKAGEEQYELGVGFQNLKSHQILALLRHLYGQNAGIPSSIA